jgi:membrane-anchored mycosin MYCP
MVGPTAVARRHRRRRARLLPLVAAIVVAGLIGALALAGTAGAAAGQDFVKWYAVQASYQGQPENLPEIAVRFLGAATRFTEIFNLNVGRPQPDGAALSDPDTLHAGWLLVLPWDAVGGEVVYGALPTAAPANAAQQNSAPANPAQQNPAQQNPAPAAGGTRAAAPKTPATPAAPGPSIAVVPSTRPANPPPGGGHCLAAVASNNQSDWATLRLAPDQAWSQTRGKGQMVAVIDSGVDGSLPQLAGHVAVGADIVSGSGRGDTDCLGTGTAMAGIIAAQPDQGAGTVGMAPDATVLPIRLVNSTPPARPSDQASAIQVAVSAGAGVLALGSYVNVGDPTVARAVAEAMQHNVVVVCPALTSPAGAPSPTTAPGRPAGCGVPAAQAGGALNVGAVGVDGRLAADYQPAHVDVVAPGLNVLTLGITGTGTGTSSGTQYAVAFVAGEAALVRAAHPNLTAAQVVHRIERTADSQSSTAPDNEYGWGLVNPAAAVNQVLNEETSSTGAQAPHPAPSSSSSGRTLAIAVVLLVGLAAGTLLAVRIRHTIRSGAATRGTPPPAEEDDGRGRWVDDGDQGTDGPDVPPVGERAGGRAEALGGSQLWGR